MGGKIGAHVAATTPNAAHTHARRAGAEVSEINWVGRKAMGKVGIIANPAAGKDIRRLVAYAGVTSNRDKINLLKRIILGIDSTGVGEIVIAPDYCGLGEAALAGLPADGLRAQTSLLEMPLTATHTDSTAAMALMRKRGVDCVVTLGGDGTNRAVVKGDRSIPLVPVSTGTNNVFPLMVEATTAGVAAGIIAMGAVDVEEVSSVHKRLLLLEDGAERDMALIDAVVLDQPFVGSKAVWDMSEVREIVCTRAEPGTMGLSSIGGCLRAVGPDDDCGLHLRIGSGGERVRAPVLPGVVGEIGVEACAVVALGEEVAVETTPCLIALDGEREAHVAAGQDVRLRLQRDGPRVIDVVKTVRQAAAKGFFRR
ncbi:MAG: NAD(+)/NADH kinase [Dehalococcoidia bacterium]|nr:NAD(+)/NADH kinase [Dehalococcoidia bacterium]